MTGKILEAWSGPGRKDGTITKFKPEHDGLRIDINKKGSAEWWYFDARLTNGYTAVAFFRARHELTGKTGVQITIYKPNEEKLELVVDYDHSDFVIEEGTANLSIGKNYIKVDYTNEKLPIFEIFLEEEDMGIHLTYKVNVEGWMPGKGYTEFGDMGQFGWVVAIPRADVEGTITVEGEEMAVKGLGYHDHNWLTFMMPRFVEYWYWGRFASENFTFIFAYIKCSKKMDNHFIHVGMLAKGEDIFLSSGDYDLTAEDFEFNEKAGNEYPKLLAFKYSDELKITMNVERIVDSDNLLTNFNPVLRFLAKHLLKLSPGYFRFFSKFDIDIVHEGKSYKEQGDMLHEMVIMRKKD